MNARRAILDAFAAHAKAVAQADERLALALVNALELPPEDDAPANPVKITALGRERALRGLRRSGRLG